ncbi:hypothetical protein AGABI2DRAFT_145169 [Agaricus bisporus var. bisporus H97]|uniref:hypothetical protein n=1 Tax=Agaricus bisporus var. bisporus (strain H97 / ATCC MYA-4626 / FGSC 10389) TaxID=936046 RepID=UPI00029F572D|nr:hypothetical protein AGABI2DRAFT_145169 [Agaricus bisporus var. bisporus H97]EKV44694.1 hypothetical protein AGABI2DRAFT_145169 [Agaricus bisporus var. bisporus H97]
MAYLICRYASDCVLIVTAYMLSGSVELSIAICRGWIWCFIWLGFCFIAFTQVLVGHRIHTLWEHRKSIKRIIFGVFIIVTLGTGVLAVLASVEMQYFARSCFFKKKSNFVTLSISLMVAFDLFLVIMAIGNALDRPRMKNGEVLARLNRDGGLSFLGLLGEALFACATELADVLLFVALCLSIWGRLMTSYMFLPPTWALSSVITSRLYYRVNKSKKKISRRREREIGVVGRSRNSEYQTVGTRQSVVALI